MIFPSYIFLLAFLPIVLTGWYAIRSLRARLVLLTTASYVFYGWWDYRFVILMMASTLLDYHCGKSIHKAADAVTRKRWLIVSICGNLGSLGFFKYYGFFAESAQQMLNTLGLTASLPVLQVILPIGISFYTFQSMSYSIDIYRGTSRPTASLLMFTSYVSMFPQLIAGPIVRYSHIEQQLTSLPTKRACPEQIADGVWLFCIGLAKKIWIADLLAPVAEFTFDSGCSPQLFTAWAGTLCYTFQLYFDFSAYSDMARGLGFMLGFDFPVNFNSPYKSADISEFWTRWHITLSQWLRDYLFIPLGGSRCPMGRTMRNLTITMFLGGLWHGAAWTFVAWGGYHGCLLVGHAAWRRATSITLPRPVGVAITFLCVAIGWTLFRAQSLGDAGNILTAMFGANGIEPFTYASATLGVNFPAIYSQFGGMHGLAFLAMVTGIAFFAPNSEQLPKPHHPACAALLAAGVLHTMTTFMKETPFLYFQF